MNSVICIKRIYFENEPENPPSRTGPGLRSVKRFPYRLA